MSIFHIGWPKEDKILLTNWVFDEEANNLLSCWCCRGWESQRLPPWLSSSHANTWCVRCTSLTEYTLNWIGRNGLWTVGVFFPSSAAELASSVKGARTRWECNQTTDECLDINTKTCIRLLRAGCARYKGFLLPTIHTFFIEGDSKEKSTIFDHMLKKSYICLPRLCSDGEAVHLYYTTDNSRVYHKEELKSFEVKAEVDR